MLYLYSPLSFINGFRQILTLVLMSACLNFSFHALGIELMMVLYSAIQLVVFVSI